MNAPAKKAYAAYRQQEVNGLQPVEIVNRLYQKLYSKLLVAKEAIGVGNVAARGESLGRALAIVGELQASLNLEQGGEIATNLNGLYDFLTRELVMVGLRNDADRLRGVLQTVEPLAEAWKEVARNKTSSASADETSSAEARPQPFHAAAC